MIISADGSTGRERGGCGPAADAVYADANDRLFTCERIFRTGGSLR